MSNTIIAHPVNGNCTSKCTELALQRDDLPPAVYPYNSDTDRSFVDDLVAGGWTMTATDQRLTLRHP